MVFFVVRLRPQPKFFGVLVSLLAVATIGVTCTALSTRKIIGPGIQAVRQRLALIITLLYCYNQPLGGKESTVIFPVISDASHASRKLEQER